MSPHRTWLVACAAIALVGFGTPRQTQPAPDAAPSATPSAPAPGASPAGESTVAPSATPASPSPTPTLVPIVVAPSSADVPVGGSVVLRVSGVLGTLAATIANGALADVAVNQDDRTVTVSGKAPGTSALTVKDDRGVTATVSVLVAYP